MLFFFVCFCFCGFLKFIYLFIYGCVGSSFLCEGFLQLWQAGATLHRGARASHYHGLSCCGAQAPDAQAQQLWLTGPVAPWHVGSSQTRARTRVPCIGRQILNHCANREAPDVVFKMAGVLRFGIVHIKFKFSVVQENIWDQILNGCPALFCMPELWLFHYDISLSLDLIDWQVERLKISEWTPKWCWLQVLAPENLRIITK